MDLKQPAIGQVVINQKNTVGPGISGEMGIPAGLVFIDHVNNRQDHMPMEKDLLKTAHIVFMGSNDRFD
jgi:hypothetical protein